MRRLRHRECTHVVTRTTELLTHKGEELLLRCLRHVLPIPVERTLSELRGRERWSPITALREKRAPVALAVRANFILWPALGESTQTPSGRHLPLRRPQNEIVPARATASANPTWRPTATEPLRLLKKWLGFPSAAVSWLLISCHVS